MNRNAIVSFIASEIATISGIHVSTDERTLLQDMPLDSLQCIELTAAIEDEYDVTITCAERVSMITVADLADLVTGLRQDMLLAA